MNHSNLKEEIKDLHRLHLVTKDFKHIIEYEPGSWKMFEPSKFVYSFFAFNTFYNFDWQETVDSKTLSNFPKHVKDGEEQEASEGTKYKALINFIFKYASEDDQGKFISFIKRPNPRENPITNQTLINCIDGITPDDKIKESEREEFKREFRRIIETETLSQSKLKNVIIRFIYLIRNNIFHGTKTTIEMSDRNQRKRLDIYSNILIATNELLFKVLNRELNISFDNHYRINLDGGS